MSRLQKLLDDLLPDKRVRYSTFLAFGTAAFCAWCSVQFLSRKAYVPGFMCAASVYVTFWLLHKYVIKRIPER